MPFMFKLAIDALNIDPTAASAVPVVGVVAMTPAALLLGYGIARSGAAFCGEMRNLVFAKVAQGAIRQVAYEVFAHLHALDLKFHLSRSTGACWHAAPAS